MHTLQSLIDDLKAIGLAGNETLLVHSSMKAVGEVEGRADTVLDAFQKYFAKGTLVFPTFTYSNVTTKNPVFYRQKTPSVTGILTERFRHRPGVIRSNHPSHSLAVLGVGAKELCEGVEFYDTIYDPAGSWGKLLKRKAYALMLGVGLDCCTFLHAIEEWCDVPVKSQRPVIRYVIDDAGKRVKVPIHWHTNAHWRNYPIAQDVLEKKGALRRCKFGDADCLLMDCAKAYAVMKPILKATPNYFGKPNRYLHL